MIHDLSTQQGRNKYVKMMSKNKTMKHFTILELGNDSESPMIGTINNVTNSRQGIDRLKERVTTALFEHFDTDTIDFVSEFPDMFTGTPYEDIEINIEGYSSTIRILETWIY